MTKKSTITLFFIALLFVSFSAKSNGNVQQVATPQIEETGEATNNELEALIEAKLKSLGYSEEMLAEMSEEQLGALLESVLEAVLEEMLGGFLSVFSEAVTGVAEEMIESITDAFSADIQSATNYGVLTDEQRRDARLTEVEGTNFRKVRVVVPCPPSDDETLVRLCFEYGVIDLDYNIVIPINNWRFRTDFNDAGLATINSESGIGVWSIAGKIVVPPRYGQVHFFNELSLISVGRRREFTLYDALTGEVVINPGIYDFVRPIEYNFFMAGKNNKTGFINRANEVIIPFEYDLARPLESGLILVRKNEKFGLINRANEIVVPIKFEVAFCDVERLIKLILDGAVEYAFDFEGNAVNI
jgi:hypothetical protein